MSNFFALMARMKYIRRWGLMKSTREENIQEHSLQTAMIAHMLALIGNKIYNKNYDADSIAVKAMYHEASEIITGDLPTPIKYYNSEIKSAYKQIEAYATDEICAMLPDEFKGDFTPILKIEDAEEKKIVKAADKLSALIKCIEELKAGNGEFRRAKASTEEALHRMQLPAIECFMQEFLPYYELTLDEQN